MTSPVSPDSGCDVLAVIKAMDMALDDANSGPDLALCVKAICRIAELIEAAEYVDALMPDTELDSDETQRKIVARLRAAIDGCRAGETT